MKTVQLKGKSKERLINIKKFRPDETNKKSQQNTLDNSQCEVKRPGSCPTSNSTSSWTPSRNWHKYLSDQQQSCKIAKLHPDKPANEAICLKLPTVNFCTGGKELQPQIQAPSISDLNVEDKKKIANLVEKLAKCKHEKQEDEKTILKLKNNISDLKTSLDRVMAEKVSNNKVIAMIKSQHLQEQTDLKKQLTELNQLLYQMQVQKSTSELQMQMMSAQAEKVTRAVHALHRENMELQVELGVAREKFNVAQCAVDKVTNEVIAVQEKLKPLTEDKACQFSESVHSEKVHVKTFDVSEKISDDQQILSELFFNKSVQNSFSPQETIIFLPAYSETF